MSDINAASANTRDQQSTSYFDYSLPQTAIGQCPAEPRDSARLLVDLDGSADPAVTKTVVDLPELLAPGDVVVINDTRVIPARLYLNKPTGGAIEVLLLEPTGPPGEWKALVKPGKRLRPGTFLELGGVPVMSVDETLDDGSRIVTIIDETLIDREGRVPLPPYITEPLGDPDRYQTVYADRPGSVAAPTAGLHLTNSVMAELESRGVSIVRVELQVGLGTFRPISAETISGHRMHAESYLISSDAWAEIQSAERVVAIGTTVVRALESAALTGELSGSTELFITSGFDWQVVDVLMTNFHVPKSSLLVMIDAFLGEQWRVLYQRALDEGFRFLSFGDAMLVSRRSLGR